MPNTPPPTRVKSSTSRRSARLAASMAYKCVYDTVNQFIRKLAVGYVARGYWFYVTGLIPEGKDATKVDAKLIAKYDIDVSPWVRARRKKAGKANVHYLRHGRFFVLLSTRGQHTFFGSEGAIRDVRRAPIIYSGLSVRAPRVNGQIRTTVSIERKTYLRLRARLLARDPKSSRTEDELVALSSLRYRGAQRQLSLLRQAISATERDD